MVRLLSYVFLQYIPFLLLVPILVVIGPFFFGGREAIRAVLLPLVGWKRAAWALPPAQVRKIAEPELFSRGSLGRMIEGVRRSARCCSRWSAGSERRGRYPPPRCGRLRSRSCSVADRWGE